ncbi:TRAP transporter large permease [Bythopirellula polymerisocia]|uniref:Sialic acid TRAP transporter permease protein SiaT n=1 Tax=Bythopirellula polymerisocia TaxID=2528003 RepID=A0A5C6D465_9BACT|nr:TRAP transporter large permease [Bythopirellula polymerisocia]TWU30457.1 Sialic acid TRAP transporter permease protein SiaT [Bythopirellula polymerisocia]
MEIQVAILIASFVVLVLINVPVAIAIGVCTLLTIVSLGTVPACTIIAQRLSTGIASFPLLAIPFFILAGILMGEGGMARRLIDFASSLVGQYRGGLSYVSTLTCMMFGAISGSATAAVSSVGGMLIPEMTRKGYDRRFSVAVTTTSATTGLVIPPSNIMIVYAVVTGGNVSVVAMFLAGVLPGITMGLAIMLVCLLVSRNKPGLAEEAATWREIFRTAIGALPSMALIVIVLAGILGGAFSPTEAAAIAVLYAFVLGVLFYQEIKLTDLPRICLQTGITTAVIFLLIGTSQALSWVLAYENIPQAVSTAMLSLSDNPYVILLLINILLLLVGTVMDMTPAVLIFTPIFLPVVTKLGMHPVHFGVMMIVNLCIGLCTPPVGTCLFVGCGVGKTTIAEVTRPMLPFFAAMLFALLLTTYWAPLSMALPQALGVN